jgi:hypothetical protein
MVLTRRQLLMAGLGAGAGLATIPWAELRARAATSPPQRPPVVLAFYYPWYGGPPTWRHWHDCGHHPERNDLDAVDYPAAGPYNSLDPTTIQRHCDDPAPLRRARRRGR